MSRPRKNAKKQPETPPMPEVEKTLEPDELSNILEAILGAAAASRPVRWRDKQRGKLQWLLRESVDALWLLDLAETDRWGARDAAKLSAMISVAAYAELYAQAQEDRWDALDARAPADERGLVSAMSRRLKDLERHRQELANNLLSASERVVLETAVRNNVPVTEAQQEILAAAVEMGLPLSRRALCADNVPTAIVNRISERGSKRRKIDGSEIDGYDPGNLSNRIKEIKQGYFDDDPF